MGSEKLDALIAKSHKGGEDVARDSSEVLLALPFYSTKQSLKYIKELRKE